jgi:hypothetical protein
MLPGMNDIHLPSPDPNVIRQHFVHQASSCERLGSPFTARLCRVLAECLDETTQTGRKVLHWPGNTRENALALRLCGALHVLVLAGADTGLAAVYPPQEAGDAEFRLALQNAIARHDLDLSISLDSAPQTNEIARAAMLLPGFLAIAREVELPLALHEIGSSAGLNLLFDRFHYRYGDAEWGDAVSPLRLAPDIGGNPVPVHGRLEIERRLGSDIAPVDIAAAEERLRLKSYIWADQTTRLQRLDAALGLAAMQPFKLERADAAAFVRRSLASRQRGAAYVLFHSIMWQYLPEDAKASITTELQGAGAVATVGSPIAWLRMEPLSTTEKHATLSLTLWPGGGTRHLAKCDYHGRWIEWLDSEPPTRQP